MRAGRRAGRPDLGADLRIALVSALTTWAAVLAWRGFTENPERFLVPLLVTGLVVAVLGSLARAARAPVVVVLALQVLVASAGFLLSVTGALLPGPSALGAAAEALRDAVDSAGRYAAPVTGDVPPVEPLLLAAALACLLVVDVVASTLRRVSLAGLPLLTVYTLPVSMLGGSVPWWVFAVPAAGYVWMLFLATGVELDRWDAGDGADTAGGSGSGFGVRTGGVRGTALGIGATATALGVVAPLAVPTLGLTQLGGDGGSGDQPISLTNPMTDLVRDLRRPEDTPLLQVTTSDPDPSYLRIAVLNRFSDEAWTSGDRDLPDDQTAQGTLPSPPGLAEAVPRRSTEWSIEVGDDFETTWLPTPYPVAAIDAGGGWKYDETTRDFIATDDDLTAAGLDYELTAVRPELSADQLERSSPTASSVGRRYLELPTGLERVAQLARVTTADATSDFGRAVALQDWFRRDGGFTYDLSAAPGNGQDALMRFLSDEDPEGRTGYCEQFASAMAVMARSLDIPARVAVGFLRPERVGAGTPARWEYSSDDLHAWPELFFPGAGWVRFEPTPAGRAAETPAYTRDLGDAPDQPAPQPGGGVDELPEQGGGTDAGGGDRGPVETSATAVARDPIPWQVPVGLATTLLLALVLLAPRALRNAVASRRARRLTPVEAVWAELSDVVVDHGWDWPTERSPGEVRDRIWVPLGSAGTSTARAGREALARLVAAVESARYARRAEERPEADLRADLALVTDAVATASSPRARRLAVWLPRSLVRGLRRTGPATDRAPGRDPSRVLVDHLA